MVALGGAGLLVGMDAGEQEFGDGEVTRAEIGGLDDVPGSVGPVGGAAHLGGEP